MDIKVDVKDSIAKSIEEVFDAIVNPEQIIKYFASEVSGKLDLGEKVFWSFDDAGVKLEVTILKIEHNKHISFQWEASGKTAVVDIELETKNQNLTDIRIRESSFELNESEVQMALGQTQGWTDFICSLKAYLYAGINLRK